MLTRIPNSLLSSDIISAFGVGCLDTRRRPSKDEDEKLLTTAVDDKDDDLIRAFSDEDEDSVHAVSPNIPLPYSSECQKTKQVKNSLTHPESPGTFLEKKMLDYPEGRSGFTTIHTSNGKRTKICVMRNDRQQFGDPFQLQLSPKSLNCRNGQGHELQNGMSFRQKWQSTNLEQNSDTECNSSRYSSDSSLNSTQDYVDVSAFRSPDLTHRNAEKCRSPTSVFGKKSEVPSGIKRANFVPLHVSSQEYCFRKKQKSIFHQSSDTEENSSRYSSDTDSSISSTQGSVEDSRLQFHSPDLTHRSARTSLPIMFIGKSAANVSIKELYSDTSHRTVFQSRTSSQGKGRSSFHELISNREENLSMCVSDNSVSSTQEFNRDDVLHLLNSPSLLDRPSEESKLQPKLEANFVLKDQFLAPSSSINSRPRGVTEIWYSQKRAYLSKEIANIKNELIQADEMFKRDDKAGKGNSMKACALMNIICSHIEGIHLKLKRDRVSKSSEKDNARSAKQRIMSKGTLYDNLWKDLEDLVRKFEILRKNNAESIARYNSLADRQFTVTPPNFSIDEKKLGSTERLGEQKSHLSSDFKLSSTPHRKQERVASAPLLHSETSNRQFAVTPPNSSIDKKKLENTERLEKQKSHLYLDFKFSSTPHRKQERVASAPSLHLETSNLSSENNVLKRGNTQPKLIFQRPQGKLSSLQQNRTSLWKSLINQLEKTPDDLAHIPQETVNKEECQSRNWQEKGIGGFKFCGQTSILTNKNDNEHSGLKNVGILELSQSDCHVDSEPVSYSETNMNCYNNQGYILNGDLRYSKKLYDHHLSREEVRYWKRLQILLTKILNDKKLLKMRNRQLADSLSLSWFESNPESCTFILDLKKRMQEFSIQLENEKKESIQNGYNPVKTSPSIKKVSKKQAKTYVKSWNQVNSLFCTLQEQFNNFMKKLSPEFVQDLLPNDHELLLDVSRSFKREKNVPKPINLSELSSDGKKFEGIRSSDMEWQLLSDCFNPGEVKKNNSSSTRLSFQRNRTGLLPTPYMSVKCAKSILFDVSPFY